MLLGMETMNYNDKIFTPISNTDNGETSENTVFHYKQIENILSCVYSGGKIIIGQLIGIVDEKGHIDMRYHQVNINGELKTGVCKSRPEILLNGKIRLYEEWQWTSGDNSSGSSILQET